LEPDRFQEWMLFPHPEQKRISTESFDKPAVLTGVSGSGKTCILLHRARHLAAKYPGQRIGILTLNRSLAKLLRNLLGELCSEEEMANIEVHAFYDYFKQLVDWFGPMAELENLRRLAADHEESEHILRAIDRVDPATYAREFDPISGETLDDTWKIFLDNPRVNTLMTYFKQHLFTYDDWADSSKYLREEFSLIRSAVSTDSRVDQYVSGDFEREGRSIPFPDKIRKITLDLLLHLEEEMLTGGILDELSLTLALLPHLKSFSNMPERFRFRCLLVDEFQDLSTRDLTLLRRVVTITDPDAFFLCGDSVQKVLVKSLNLNRAGLAPVDIARRRILKNYRNSKNILQAASHLARIYGEQARKLKEDVETLDPDLAVRETAWPQAVEAAPGEELKLAWAEAREIIAAGGSLAWSVCIVTACDEGHYSVENILRSCPRDFPVKAERLTGDYTRNQDTMTVASMSDVKGFEFSMVIIVGCGVKTLPNPGGARDESWRDALRLYVAMTRARDGVQLYYTGEPSPFLADMNEHIEWFELTDEAATA
jgi:superfamily I DNA/RNA helicase